MTSGLWGICAEEVAELRPHGRVHLLGGEDTLDLVVEQILDREPGIVKLSGRDRMSVVRYVSVAVPF